MLKLFGEVGGCAGRVLSLRFVSFHHCFEDCCFLLLLAWGCHVRLRCFQGRDGWGLECVAVGD
jgi:hypothetical protein